MSMTIEQVRATIKAARDSVWVVNDSIEKLASPGADVEMIKGNIERNVSHLKLVVGNSDISGSGEDIDDLQQAITDGEEKLAELE